MLNRTGMHYVFTEQAYIRSRSGGLPQKERSPRTDDILYICHFGLRMHADAGGPLL